MPGVELTNSTLNPQQQEAVKHRGAPLLVLAGAGSGKTRVITFKIAHLIDTHQIDPSYITAVTFTNRAAREMRKRAIELCSAAHWSHICTFHSYGASFLRRYASQANINPRFSIYDDDESIGLLSILYPHESRTALAHIGHKISRAKNFALLPTDDLTTIDSSALFATYYERYQSYLEEIGNMDFGDLILRPLQILRQYPAIRREEQRRTRVLLIDEYQDTNQAQYALIKTLYHSQLYLCAVGDDDQSIYRFRGADITHIIDFDTNFKGSTVMRLEQNYRSTSPILSLADAVVNNNNRRHPKRLWTEQPGGSLPELAILENDFQEARYCVEKIQHDWMQIETTILYRTNAQSRLFEAELTRYAIAYKIIGSVRFYNREEIKDLVAFLKFLYNPQDEVSFRRIVNKPARGIGAASQQAITAGKRGGSNLIEALLTFSAGTEGTEKGRQGAQKVIDVCRRAQILLHSVVSPTSDEEQTREDNLGGVIRFISEESGLSEYHRNQDIDSHGSREQNIEEFIRSTTHMPRSYDGLYHFLESIELESGAREERGRGSSDSYVTLMTMHNTKGLEFERVFIAGLQDGLFPRLTEHNIEEIEEERRLLYVAITRAKRWLFLTSYRIRNLYGRAQENSVSRFLEEIPKELFHCIDYSSQEQNRDYCHRQRAYSSHSLSSAPSEREKEGARFSLGEHVYHDDYGAGVISARKLESDQVLIQVNFQSGRVAHFIERYAALDKIAADGS